MTVATRDMALLAERRGVHVECTPLATEAALPAADLRRCLVALIDNAIDHSPPGGTVAVSAVADRSVARITVADSGSGITGIEPARVFDRFAHGAPVPPDPGDESGSRTRFGIGLALVSELAARHGGEVRVARTGSSGTVFELVIPLPAGAAR